MVTVIMYVGVVVGVVFDSAMLEFKNPRFNEHVMLRKETLLFNKHLIVFNFVQRLSECCFM